MKRGNNCSLIKYSSSRKERGNTSEFNSQNHEKEGKAETES